MRFWAPLVVWLGVGLVGVLLEVYAPCRWFNGMPPRAAPNRCLQLRWDR